MRCWEGAIDAHQVCFDTGARLVSRDSAKVQSGYGVCNREQLSGYVVPYQCDAGGFVYVSCVVLVCVSRVFSRRVALGGGEGWDRPHVERISRRQTPRYLEHVPPVACTRQEDATNHLVSLFTEACMRRYLLEASTRTTLEPNCAPAIAWGPVRPFRTEHVSR